MDGHMNGIDVKSRMTRHIRSVKRLASSISGHDASNHDEEGDENSFIVVLDSMQKDGHSAHNHRRHILEHHDSGSSGFLFDKTASVQILAESSIGNTTAITEARNDWSYDTMAVAFLSAAAGLFVFYLILDHPRLFARIFSSPIGKRRLVKRDVSELTDDSAPTVRTLGGEFWSGWFLKAGAAERKPMHITSPMINPGDPVTTIFDEKRDSIAALARGVRRTEKFSRPLQETGRRIKHTQSDETLFSYYGSADSPQDMDALPYQPVESRQRQHTLQVITDLDDVSPRPQMPAQRCLTGNIQPLKTPFLRKHQSIDSCETAVSPSSTEFEPHAKSNHGTSAETTVSIASYEKNFKNDMTVLPRQSVYAPPPHVAPLTAYVPYLQKVLLWTPLPRHLPHLTFASVVLVALYVFLVAFSTLFKSSVAFDWKGPDVLRSGMIGMMQIPIILGLGGRGSVFRFLLFGTHTNAALRIHKLAGRLCFLCSAMHTGLWMRKWMISGQLAKASSDLHIIWGYVAVAALGLITISSLPWIRKMAYGVFMICHIIGLVLFLAGLALHVPEAIPYCVAGGCLYLADLSIRAARTRITTASLQVVPGCDSTMVTVPGLREGWRAGQYIVLRIPKLGGLGGIEGHEFTIASAPEADGLTLVIKNAGNWSNRLLNMSLENEKAASALNTTVIVEGPYGGPGNMIIQSFSSVLLIAGGSGITYALGIAHDLILKASLPPYNVRARSVNMVWATKTKEAVEGLLPTFQKLIDSGHKAEQDSPYGTTLRIHVYVTRQPAVRPRRFSSIFPAPHEHYNVVDLNDSRVSVAPEGLTESGIDIKYGLRPDLDALLSDTVELTTKLDTGNCQRGLSGDGKPQGIAVAVCGPDALVVRTREAVRSMAQSKLSRVGGIELLEESFCH